MNRWILADASHQGQVRFAVYDQQAASINDRCSLASDAHPTFTDALLAFANRVGLNPCKTGCVLSVGGPPVSDVVAIARSRWTISRAGLASMFDGRAHVINDVAAIAWSLVGEPAPALESLVGPAPGFGSFGRWAVVTIGEGLGGAVLGTDDRLPPRVSTCEPGHMDFAPRSALQCSVLGHALKARKHVSWEDVLCGATPGLLAPGEWPAAVGNFVGNYVIAAGAWNGVILAGNQAVKLREPDALESLRTAFSDRPKYGRKLAGASCSLLVRPDPLLGCAEYLRRKAGSG